MKITPEEMGLGNPYGVLRPSSDHSLSHDSPGSPHSPGNRHPPAHPAWGLKGKLRRQKEPDPVKWLERNGGNKWAEVSTHPARGNGWSSLTQENLWKSVPSLGYRNPKPKAALISLVRNSELEGIMQSMRQLEQRWNRKYRYPWIFFNDEPFSEEFKV